MPKLIRITTVPISLEKLLEGQLNFMQSYFEVTAVSSEKERLAVYGKTNNIKVFPLEMTRKITPFADLKAILKLAKFLKKEKPYIVHTHTPKAGLVGMVAAKMAGVPHRLHTVAGLPLMEAEGAKRKLLISVEKIIYKLSTKVYPNSKGLKDFILENQLAPASKLKIIGNGSSNGIDTSYFDSGKFSIIEKEKLRKELGISAKDVVFIFVGRIVKDKGIEELVKSFEEISQTEKNTKLLLVGPLEQELNPIADKILKAIEQNPNIISVGYQEDVRGYFAISNILTFPSYREGFPNVVMQAGSMGLPIIATNINGCNEIIKEGENGLLIPPKNKESLKNAMLELLSDHEKRSKLASNARNYITRNYERKEVWEMLLQEYQNLKDV